MPQLVLCTGNPGKLRELSDLLPDGLEVLSHIDLGLPRDLPEEFDDLERNAVQKASFVFERTGHLSLADDTGLEVEALGGRPGALSARFAGPERDPEANMDKLLEALVDQKNRKARFRTVMALVGPEGHWTCEGVVNGSITHHRKGSEGFGYDPIFLPEGEERTFAEMDRTSKNRLSHRARALHQVIAHLNAEEGRSTPH
ncbi:MAG: RdgB/HAM1 family non-canonical purine NTP pyrophosphatase [Flavobacteriales bacterium]|nr:RdgB/HAM1 family non-canonical purine NTP pyrophosphatase [Flavobacteriales bacterium]